MSLRRFFSDNELDAPNVGSWARRVAAGLEKTSGQGSWARRVVEDINEENDLGPGSWKARLNAAIRKGLVTEGGGGPQELFLVGINNTQPSNINVTTMTVDKPNDVLPGDLIIFIVQSPPPVSASPTYVPPTGFSDDYELVAMVNGASSTWGDFRVYYRISDGTEDESFSFTTDSGGGKTVTIAVFRGADPAMPFYVNMTNYNEDSDNEQHGMPFVFSQPSIELYHHNRRFNSSASSLPVELTGDPDVVFYDPETWAGIRSGVGIYNHPLTARARSGVNNLNTRARLFSIVINPENSGLAIDYRNATFPGTRIREDTYGPYTNWNIAESDGERYLNCVTGSINSLRTIYIRTWSQKKNDGFSEVLARVRKQASGAGCYVWAKFNGDASSNRTGVFLGSSGAAALRADGDTTLMSGIVEDQWYWVRVQDDGQGNARASIWLDGEEEPEEWMQEVDAETSSVGHPGLGSWSNQESQFSYWSTSHDPAVPAPMRERVLLNDLDDVNIDGALDGAELMFNETAGQWQPSETT